MKNKYKIIALAGKAGTGKDTLLHAVMEQYPNLFHKKVSCTTRPPREGEKDGVDYYFISNEEFTTAILNNKFVEHDLFNNWGYGTLKESLSLDKVNIGIFNPSGVIQLAAVGDIDLYMVELRVPDKERLIRQLNREKDPDV